MLGMSRPRPDFTPSRLNVGAYAVTVERTEVMRFSEVVPAAQVLALLKARSPFLDQDAQAAFSPAGIELKQRAKGTVNPDGSLSVERERWAARHYRRAVMSGAGVYRLGLWAFLASRRGLHFTAPEPGASVEPYRVRVEGEVIAHGGYLRAARPLARAEALKLRGSIAALRRGVLVTRISARGTVTPDGSLSIRRNAYRSKHYRRVLARGAGVYQVGLWAFLGSRRAVEPLQAVAALGVNDARTAQAFVTLPPPAPRGQWVTIEPKQYRRQNWRMYRQGLPHGVSLIPYKPTEHMSCYFRRMLDAEWVLQGQVMGEGWASAAAHVRLATLRKKHYSLEFQTCRVWSLQFALRHLGLQGDAYRAHLARMVKAQRPSTRAPRPLHAHPRPPAAPLAPPAL